MSSKIEKANLVEAAVEVPSLLTLAAARKGVEAEQAKDLAASIRAQSGAVQRVQGEVMWNAALLYLGAKAHIGKDGVWTTQGHYASAVGVSAGYASRIKWLSVAVDKFGVTRGSAEFQFLSRFAERKDLKPLLESDLAPKDFKAEVRTLAKAVEDNGGKFPAIGRGPQDTSGTSANDAGRGGDGADSTPTEATGPEQVEASLDDVLRWLERHLIEADRETFAAAENRLEAMMAKVVGMRTAEARGKANAEKASA